MWSEGCQGAFVKLRNALASEPVLRVPVKPDHPEFQPLVVHTDALDMGLGGGTSPIGYSRGSRGGACVCVYF